MLIAGSQQKNIDNTKPIPTINKSLVKLQILLQQ